MTIKLDDVDRLAHKIGNYTGTVEQMVARRRGALRTVQDRAVEAVADYLEHKKACPLTARMVRDALAAARKPVKEKCCPTCTCFCRRKPDVKLIRERLEAAMAALEPESDA